jgi:TRAP-type C4-dicarboxylate transport system permease small subunit
MQTVDYWLHVLCRFLALLGGALLLAVTVMTVASVTGRALIFAGLGPVPGDFELVEHGTALAMFCFLPWCQLNRGHVTVDVLAGVLGPRRDAALSVISNIIMTGVAVLIVWRLWFGMLDKAKFTEETFILQLPIWWGYAAALIPAAVFAVASAYTVWRSIRETGGDGPSTSQSNTKTAAGP